MKINKIILSVSSLAVCGTLSAQDLRGVVRDADNQPLVGASVYWEGTTIGASTDAQGAFLLHRVKGYDNLVASYLGYVNDTLRVAGGAERIEFTLASEGVALEDVVVEGNLSGNFVKRDGIVKGEMISFAGLCKMACCNLAESFENSASVTVGYSDAISGARQIKMLGLAGTYTQILDENRPIMRDRRPTVRQGRSKARKKRRRVGALFNAFSAWPRALSSPLAGPAPRAGAPEG